MYETGRNLFNLENVTMIFATNIVAQKKRMSFCQKVIEIAFLLCVYRGNLFTPFNMLVLCNAFSPWRSDERTYIHPVLAFSYLYIQHIFLMIPCSMIILIGIKKYLQTD